MKTSHARALAYALLFLLSAAIAAPIWIIAQEAYLRSRGKIVEHLRGEVLTPLVQRGGTALIKLYYRKREDCPGAWSYASRAEGEFRWRIGRQGVAGTNPPGAYSIVHEEPIADAAPLGVHEWIETVAFDCGVWTSVSRSPVMRFEVVP